MHGLVRKIEEDPSAEGRARRTRPGEIAVGAKEETHSTMTYNDRAITYTGDLASYDYDSILRDKQGNISSLFQLADYYVDADPIFRESSTACTRPLRCPGSSGWWVPTSR